MTNEEKLIAALETTIETQKQLIKHLSAEIDRLNLTKLFIAPNTLPVPGSPYPYYTPNPMVPFTTPVDPLGPPYIVKCENGTPVPTGAVMINGFLKESLRQDDRRELVLKEEG